jgi:hypothetical protein
MKKTIKTENNPLLSIRFRGQAITKNTMPIYELGSTFIAIQRIVNKSHLFNSDRLEKGAKLSFHERKETALRIVENKEGSDEYGLITFLSDPVVIDHVKTLIVDSLLAISAYTLGKVLSKNATKKIHNQTVIASIFNEVLSVTDRIENISGVESIEIFPGKNVKGPKIKINMETQEYVREIQNKVLFGEEQVISGYITKMYPNRFQMDIKVAPNYYTKIHVSPEDFDVLRYKTQTGQLIEFYGKPMYKLGQITKKIKEFESVKVNPSDKFDPNFEI